MSNDVHACRYDAKLNAYIPYNKAWIKEQVLSHLQNVAISGGRSGGNGGRRQQRR